MYQGHCSDGSSIQKHSAGPLYPFVIVFTGEAGRDMHVMLGDVTCPVPSVEAASVLVEVTRAKARRTQLSLHRCFAFVVATLKH